VRATRTECRKTSATGAGASAKQFFQGRCIWAASDLAGSDALGVHPGQMLDELPRGMGMLAGATMARLLPPKKVNLPSRPGRQYRDAVWRATSG